MSLHLPHVARTDWGILLIVLALVLVGLVMVYSASYHFALVGWEDVRGPAHFFWLHLRYAAVGLVAMLIAWRVDYHLYRAYAIPILVVTIVVLLVMALLQGRWLLGDERFRSIQPLEVAKYGAIVYIAVWLESTGQEIRKVTFGLVPFALLLGLLGGLMVAQKDFSSTVLFLATATAMFFAAGADLKQLLIGGAAGGGALAAVSSVIPYLRQMQARLTVWPDPLSDPRKAGFQTVQSLIALNRGGLFGVGFTQSLQKLHLGRVAHTDYIFAIIAEEWGFVGAAMVMGLFALWVWRGLRLARVAADPFGRHLAVGLVTWVALQAALNVAVVTNSTPVTGTVLPFVSYGGSSLISGLASVGILLNISRADHHRRRERNP